MDFLAVCQWVAFVAAFYTLVQNEYRLWTGKKKNDTREKKVFRYAMWIVTLGFLVLALMGQ
jgi:4-hydroxybenzoate polyprenyltransferase